MNDKNQKKNSVKPAKRGLWQILKYAASSGISFVLDYAINLGVLYLIDAKVFVGGFGSWTVAHRVVIAYLVARLFSSMLNFYINHKLVFTSQERLWRSVRRYYTLCIPQAALGSFLTDLLAKLLKQTNPLLNTGLKFCVDVVLFCISFMIQKFWVFKKQEPDKKSES